MEPLVIVLMITLIITIVIALGRQVTADKHEAKIHELDEPNRKQSDELRKKGIQVDRLTKNLAKYQREEETRVA